MNGWRNVELGSIVVELMIATNAYWEDDRLILHSGSNTDGKPTQEYELGARAYTLLVAEYARAIRPMMDRPVVHPERLLQDAARKRAAEARRLEQTFSL